MSISHLILRKVIKTYCSNNEVLSGPLKGLVYNAKQRQGKVIIPKKLGVYECELHDILSEIIKNSPNNIIVVGAEDGYYAFGFAKFTDSKIIAYETEKKFWDEIKESEKINCRRNRIELHGFCDTDSFNQVLNRLNGSTFIFMDCEGGEKELLNLNKSPNLCKANILVEAHDFADATITPTIIENMSNSHNIKIIHEKKRTPENFPIKNPIINTKFFDKAKIDFMSEGRPEMMSWLWLVPKPS